MQVQINHLIPSFTRYNVYLFLSHTISNYVILFPAVFLDYSTPTLSFVSIVYTLSHRPSITVSHEKFQSMSCHLVLIFGSFPAPLFSNGHLNLLLVHPIKVNEAF